MTKVQLSSSVICMYVKGFLFCNNIYSDEILELATQLLKINSTVTLNNLSKYYDELVLMR